MKDPGKGSQSSLGVKFIKIKVAEIEHSMVKVVTNLVAGSFLQAMQVTVVQISS